MKLSFTVVLSSKHIASEFDKMEEKNGKMVNSSLRHRHGHLGKFLINCDSGVSPSGVFICTIAGNYSVLHATVVVLGNNGSV